MSSRRWPSVFAASAVLFAGLTNAHAHVHLDLDGHGRAPSAALHLVGNHVHHQPERGGDHQDVDVDVPNQAFAKTFKYDLPLVVPLAGWAPPLSPGAAIAPRAGPEVVPKPSPPFLRPRLRAPPG